MLNDWYALGGVQYRKWHIYDLPWTTTLEGASAPISLEQYLVCGAPFGGPVAMMLDSRRFTGANNTASVPVNFEQEKNKLIIYTSCGKELSRITWNESRPVVGMGWTDQENLVVVADNGVAKMYDLQGRFVTDFQLLDMTDTTPILEIYFWGNGAAAITSSMVIKVVEGLSATDLSVHRPRVYALDARAQVGKERTYTSMAIIPPMLSRSGLLEVLLGTSDCSVLVIHEANNETIVEDQLLQKKLGAAITKMALAPDGRFVACYKKDGVLTVMSSAFSRKVIDFDTKSASRPITIEWCGKDAVIMQWKNTGLVMVGPFGDWINFPYDSAGIHIVPEVDCCRIITSTSCEILQLVPAATVAALEIGSTEPAALIIDAMEAFEEGDPKSDENIRTIAATNQLAEAVHSCVQAAASEFFPTQQQRLLKAASYGKAFCPDLDPSEFVETAKKLRVLNEVRNSLIGIPLTLQQYNRLTPEVLVGRLTMRNQHLLALKICELLRLKNERVLIHWACEKIRGMAMSSASDEEISQTIKTQLSRYGRISSLAIAEAAYNIGRRRLATIILDREQQPDDQIPLLLKMNEEELALQKAINSEDTDLIYYTLISLESRVLPDNKASLDSFYRIVHNHPEAANLLKIYYRNKISSVDRSLLHNLLLYSKNYLEAGNAAVHQAFQQMSSAGKTQYMKEACTLYTQGKDTSFMRVLVDEQVELLDIQKQLEKKVDFVQDIHGVNTEFTAQTLHQTLSALIELFVMDEAHYRWADQEIQKLVKKFKVSEKTIYYIKIEHYAKHKKWSPLSKFAGEKKSPVGYRPFALACLKYKAIELETERYIEKISVPEDKYELYLEIRAYSKAVDVAVKLRDGYRLQEVGRLCQNPDLERYIQDQLAKL